MYSRGTFYLAGTLNLLHEMIQMEIMVTLLLQLYLLGVLKRLRTFWYMDFRYGEHSA